MNDVGAQIAAARELHAIAERDLVHVRRLHFLDDLFGEAGDRQVVDQAVVAGEAVLVEPLEGAANDFIRRNELTRRSADRIDLRSEVLELIGRVAAARRCRVSRTLGDYGHVAAVILAEAVLAVASQIENCAEPWTDA